MDRLSGKEQRYWCLKRLLGQMATFAKKGPWRRCWIKAGYDPHLDRASAELQIVDFRVPFELDISRAPSSARFLGHRLQGQLCLQVWELREKCPQVRTLADDAAYRLQTCDPTHGWWSEDFVPRARAVLLAAFREEFADLKKDGRREKRRVQNSRTSAQVKRRRAPQAGTRGGDQSAAGTPIEIRAPPSSGAAASGAGTTEEPGEEADGSPRLFGLLGDDSSDSDDDYEEYEDGAMQGL
jgi:hypothetical protein